MDASPPPQSEPSHAPSAAAPAAPRVRRARRPRRRGWRVLVGLVLLLLVVGAVTQVVLWTNVPRDLVLKQLQTQLGLRITAASLSTGWLGDTRLRDVTIALPLVDESLVTVPEMRVKHTSLFGLAWSRAVTLDKVELRNPHVVVRQDAAGRWNLQDVADLLARTAGKQAAADGAKKSARPTLPAVVVVDAVVDVIDRRGRTSRIDPVNVEGEPVGALTWEYTAAAGKPGAAAPAANPAVTNPHATHTPATNPSATTAPAAGTSATVSAAPGHPATLPSAAGPVLHVSGRLVTGGTWEHEVEIRTSNPQAWFQPLADAALPAVSFDGRWHGQVKAGGGVGGRLIVEKLETPLVRADGALSVATESAAGSGMGVAVRPESVVLHTAFRLVPDLRVTGGRVLFDGKAATADALTVMAFEGAARVNGTVDLAAAAADLTATWSDFAVPGQKVTHGGSLTATVRHPLPGRPVVSARLVSSGKMPSGAWQADLALGGSGADWRNVDWEFKADRLSVDGPQPLKLDGLAANLQTRGHVVSLIRVQGPGQVVARGTGAYDLSTRDWNARLDLSNLPRPYAFGQPGTLAFTLNARGGHEYVIFDNPGVSLRGTELEVRADGSYVFDVPKPMDVNVFVNHAPRRNGDGDQPPIFGYLRGEAHVLGTLLQPTDLSITGHLVGRDVRVLNREIGDVKLEVTGKADEQRITLRTQQLDLLDGKWQLDAVFPDQGMLGMNLSVVGLPLAEVGKTLNQPDLTGTVDARLAFVVPRLHPDAVKATGDVKARGVKFRQFAADTVEAAVVVSDGTLIADPVRLRKGDGEASVAAELDVREFRRVRASLALAAWPFEPSPGTRAELWGGTQGVRVSLPGAMLPEGIRRGVFRAEEKAQSWWVSGPIDLRAALTLKDRPAGDLSVLADMRGRTVDLRSLTYDGLDGTVQGQGTFNFDRPYETRGSLFFEDFDASRTADFFPGNDALVGFGGRFSGRATIGPAPGPYALGPLRIRGEVNNVAGRYRTIPVGPVVFNAFTNFDRIVVQDSPTNPTTIELAGGLVRVWGRLSRLEPGDELSATAASRPLYLSQMQVSFGRLDLDQIVKAFKPDSEPMVGKLSGSLEALAGTRPRPRPGQPPSGQGMFEKVIRRITADGRLEVTESELGNLDVVAFLYNAMSIGTAPSAKTPDGRGGMTFHVEDGLLSLNNIRYFNRGTEIRGIIDIDEIWRMPNSPISGTAVGTARPFRDLKLPFLSTYDLDTLLTVLQTDLTTVGIHGTVSDPKIDNLAFTDLGSGMRSLVIGDLDREQRSGKAKPAPQPQPPPQQ